MSSSLFTPALSRREALRRFGLLGSAAALSTVVPPMRAAVPSTPPALAGAQPGFYRFRIGDFEALALTDGQLILPNEHSPYAVAPSDLRATLRGGFLREDQISLAITVLLVRTKTDLVLVDTGCGALFGPVGGRLVANLASAGVRPEQVSVVMLSHLHGDHFGGLLHPESGEPVFRHARYVIHRKEHDFWMNNPDLSASASPPEVRAQAIINAQKTVNSLAGKWELVSPRDRLIDGVELLDSPGHTPGHVGVAFTSGSEQLINIADVVHHHVISFAHPEWSIAFDTDATIAARTRRQVLDRFATDRARVFGTHLPLPGLGHVRAANGAFEYVPEPWQVS